MDWKQTRRDNNLPQYILDDHPDLLDWLNWLDECGQKETVAIVSAAGWLLESSIFK